MINLGQLTKQDHLALLFILIGATLRWFGFSDWSLSNDELSALHRLDYHSFSELIEKGIWVDGHPALVQVFLFYWTQLFGNTPAIVRLPFVLLSIGSLIYFYKLASSFLHKNAALFSLALFIPSQLFILYGQIARPYSVGLFFVLGFSYYFFQFINKSGNKRFLLLSIFFGVGASLSHYFATLSIAILLFLGLFLLKKVHIKGYLIICLGIIILFLPHLGITLNHLSIGGVGWLPPPTSDFFLHFIEYIFNQSLLFYISIGCCLVVLIATNSFRIILKKQLLLLLLFLLPFAIAYYYSLHKSPVLQYSVLIFSAPYSLLFLGAFVKKESKFQFISLLCFLLLGLGVYSLVFGKAFYKKKQFANFKEVITLSSTLQKEFNQDNMISIGNANNGDYLSYYIQLIDSTFHFNISSFPSPEQVGNAIELIHESEKEYVLISFAGVPVPAEIHEYAKQKFPIVEFHRRFFNSEVILYKRGDANSRQKFHHTEYLEYSNNSKWNVDKTLLQTNLFHGWEDSISYLQEVNDIYSLTYKDSLKNLVNDSNESITISALLRNSSKPNNKLVFSVERDGENVYWRGIEIAPFYKKNKWYPFLYVFQKPDDLQPNDFVSIFFWNPDQSTTYIDNFKIQTFEDSDYNYYEF